jgi:hypothetical protein
MAVHFSVQPEALLIGAMSGGETLPKLRSAMRAADVVTGVASPHIHPRIEASALAPLLTAAGFINAVVDLDRVQVAYRSFARLVAASSHGCDEPACLAGPHTDFKARSS